MTIKIKKIKIGKIGITVDYEKLNNNKSMDAYQIVSCEDHEPEFLEAIGSVLNDFKNLSGLEIPDEKLTIKGVVFSENSEESTVMILARYSIETAMSGIQQMSLNSPLFSESDWPIGMANRIDLINHFGERFILGHRAQGALFDFKSAQAGERVAL